MSFLELPSTDLPFQAMRIIILLIALYCFYRACQNIIKVVQHSNVGNIQHTINNTLIFKSVSVFFFMIFAIALIGLGCFFGTTTHVTVSVEAEPKNFEYSNLIDLKTRRKGEVHRFKNMGHGDTTTDQWRIDGAMISANGEIFIEVYRLQDHINKLNTQLLGLQNDRNGSGNSAVLDKKAAAEKTTSNTSTQAGY